MGRNMHHIPCQDAELSRELRIAGPHENPLLHRERPKKLSRNILKCQVPPIKKEAQGIKNGFSKESSPFMHKRLRNFQP